MKEIFESIFGLISEDSFFREVFKINRYTLSPNRILMAC